MITSQTDLLSEPGGYSDRALMSGTISHLSGLVDIDVEISQEWWSNENLDMVCIYSQAFRNTEMEICSSKKQQKRDVVDDRHTRPRFLPRGRDVLQAYWEQWKPRIRR